MAHSDITNSKFGHLLALERVASPRSRAARYLFQCDCGNKKEIDARNVTTGRTRTCGKCQLFSKIKSESATQKARVNRQYMSLYRKDMAQAVRDGIQWSIGPDKYLELIHQPCHLCGSPPTLRNKRKNVRGNYINLVGSAGYYQQDNVYVSCLECTRAFGKVSISQILEQIRKVFHYLYSKK